MPPPLLVSNLTNIRYLTGLQMTAGMMLITNNKKELFVDDRYLEKAKKESKRGITVLPIQELEKRVKRYKSVRFESKDVTHARWMRWKKRFRGTKLIPSEELIETMRAIKKKTEIESIQKACRITDQVMQLIPMWLKTGITERELAWKIERASREYGAEAMSFEMIVGFGDHTARPHHMPTERKLKKRDIVQIDMGVKVDGYCSDCSRVYFKGIPTKEQKGTYAILLESYEASVRATKAGVTNHAIDRAARSVLKKYDMEQYLKGAGHGVGLDIHEGTILSKRAPKHTIKKNEVITIEPGIYLPEKWGMRIEDTILVTAKGGKRLTKAQF